MSGEMDKGYISDAVAFTMPSLGGEVVPSDLMQDIVTEGSFKVEYQRKAGGVGIVDVLPLPDRLPISVQELHILEPHGLCRGAEVAIDYLNKALEIIDGREPIYMHNDLLHNARLMADFESRGLTVVRERTSNGDWDWDAIPDNSIYGISAHGARPSDVQKALEKGCLLMDFTCVLVDKEHKKAEYELKQGHELLLFGKKIRLPDGRIEIHPESRGTLGVDSVGGRIHLIDGREDYDNFIRTIDPTKSYAWLNQTTIPTDVNEQLRALASVDIEKFRDTTIGQGCYATDDRQKAVVDAAKYTDATIIVTSERSNNGSNLVKRAQQVYDQRADDAGLPRQERAYLINGADELQLLEWFPRGSGIKSVSLGSAASTPEDFFERVIHAVGEQGVFITNQSRANSREPNPFPLRRANIEGLCARYGLPVPIVERIAV